VGHADEHRDDAESGHHSHHRFHQNQFLKYDDGDKAGDHGASVVIHRNSFLYWTCRIRSNS
jgi:hypothetical protein